MTQERWTEVDHYIVDALVRPDDALESALRASAAAGLVSHNVSPNQGKFLHLLARIHRARSILEIGTLGGYSTIWLGRALPPEGSLVTLEVDARCAEVARANLARAGLEGVVDVRLGRALDILPHLEAEGRGPFDMIFIDADKSSNSEYLAWALKLSRPGTLIVGDNVVRDGAVVDSTSVDPSVQGIRRFYSSLAADRRLIATAIQTVGSKGYDGFAMILVGA